MRGPSGNWVGGRRHRTSWPPCPWGGETAKASTRALTKLGPASVRAIVERYSSLSPPARLAAIRVLGDVGDSAGAPLLVASLEDPGTRAEAVWALGRLGDEKFGEMILRHVDDPRWEVRLESARALGSLEYAPAQSALETVRNEDPVPAVREWAARSLAILRGEPQTYPDARGEWVAPDEVYR